MNTTECIGPGKTSEYSSISTTSSTSNIDKNIDNYMDDNINSHIDNNINNNIDNNINNNIDNNSTKREACRLYFDAAVKSFGATNSGMLLKSAHEDMANDDSQEIYEILLKYLPKKLHDENNDETNSKNSKRFKIALEIGAGIGRLTPFLQSLCEELIAVDFVKEYIDKNKLVNYKDGREDQFLYQDATKLNYPNEHFDFIFWNWLMMYLDDEETRIFLGRSLNSLKTNGYLFFRESCNEPSNKDKTRSWAKSGNPTEYRHPKFYTQILENAAKTQGFVIDFIAKERTVTIYQNKNGTDGQKWWLLQKKPN